MDRESPAVVVGQRVADGVVGRIGIAGERGDPNRRADHGVFKDIVRRRIRIGDRRDIELVHIANGDSNRQCAERTVLRGGADRDFAGWTKLAINGAGNRDDACRRIDREAAAAAVVQRIGDCVVGRVGIGCEGGNTDEGSDGGVFQNVVRGRIDVRDRGDGEFVDVANRDRERRGAERTVRGCRANYDRGAGGRLAIHGAG